jgi:hypothetical protein
MFEGLLLPLLAVGLLFWIAYFTYAPFRRVFLRIPRRASKVWTLVLGIAALVFAAASALLGKTTLGGSVIVAAEAPTWFWYLIKLQAGAGCFLLVLGLLGLWRSK